MISFTEKIKQIVQIHEKVEAPQCGNYGNLPPIQKIFV